MQGFLRYQMPSQFFLKVKNLISEFKCLRHMYELGAVDKRKVKETIVLKLTNDPHENAMMLPQIGPDRMLDGAFDEAPTCNYVGLGSKVFEVLLVDERINKVIAAAKESSHCNQSCNNEVIQKK